MVLRYRLRSAQSILTHKACFAQGRQKSRAFRVAGNISSSGHLLENRFSSSAADCAYVPCQTALQAVHRRGRRSNVMWGKHLCRAPSSSPSPIRVRRIRCVIGVVNAAPNGFVPSPHCCYSHHLGQARWSRPTILPRRRIITPPRVHRGSYKLPIVFAKGSIPSKVALAASRACIHRVRGSLELPSVR